MATATAEKPRTEDNPLGEDDYYSQDGSDYDSYSEDDLDEPVTESDAENKGEQQRRRKLRTQQADYYDDDYDDEDDDEDYDSEEDDAGVAMQQNRQGGGRMEPAADVKKSMDEEDGLKLKVEINLEVEIELKAAIHGDLTLSLL
jgi:hypothetical protein